MERQLPVAMLTIIKVFHEHAAKDGDKLTLSKGEVKDLLKTQFGEMLGDTSDQAKLDQIFQDLDGDGKLDFEEFMISVTSMTMVLNAMLKEFPQQQA